MRDSQELYAMPKKSHTKRYIQYDPIYITCSLICGDRKQISGMDRRDMDYNGIRNPLGDEGTCSVS